jgi:hypothetical protein
MLKTSPPPKSKRTSSRWPPVGRPPKSMNGSAAPTGVVVTLPTDLAPISLACHHRNKLALIRSRWQNSRTVSPQLDCLEHNFSHPSVPRLIRLPCAIDFLQLLKTGGHCPDPQPDRKNAACLPLTLEPPSIFALPMPRSGITGVGDGKSRIS